MGFAPMVVFCDEISGNAPIRHHERRRRAVIQVNGGFAAKESSSRT
jgi:hypothetical protein